MQLYLKRLFVFCLFSIISLAVLAQDKNQYKKYFEEGSHLFIEQNYQDALNCFLRAFQIDSSSDNIYYKLGVAYLFSPNNKEDATRYLEKAAKHASEHYSEFDYNETRAPILAIYYLGIAYQYNYQFENAAKKFQFCANMVSDKKMPPDIKLHLDQCNTGIQLMKKKEDVRIENMGPNFNTKYPEYCPVINADESTLIFTSRRPGGVSDEKSSDGQYYEDIYICYRYADSTWSKPKLISRNINTESNDAAIGLSADGRQLFIYSTDHGGDILYSNFEDGGWSTPLPLGSDVNSKYWETHACLSADGQTLYFVSDRPGGYGGRDIYKCTKLPNGTWSKASNLGASINTAFDEDAPFIHPDGVTLFFSSNGPGSMGGFDIFKSTRTDINDAKHSSSKWSKPVNLGNPINTPLDDIYYVLSADGKRAYFSSSRKGSLGDKDLFKMTISQPIINPVALLTGTLTFDGSSKVIPKDVRITATDDATGELVQEIRPNVRSGKYILVLDPGDKGKTYTLRMEAPNYSSFSEKIKIAPGTSYEEIKREIKLRPVNFEGKKDGTIALSGFVTDKDKNVVKDIKVIVKDNSTGAIVKTYVTLNDSGYYYASLESGKNYSVSFEAAGYLFHSENISVPKQNSFSFLHRDIVIEKVSEGSSVALKNVFFEQGKSTLSTESKVELDKIYDLLTQNPLLQAEISGYSGNEGTEDVNMKLSQDRAQAVVDYLVNNQKEYYVKPFYYKGIDVKRLVAKGYGSAYQTATNNSDQGSNTNRRVVMKIIQTK